MKEKKPFKIYANKEKWLKFLEEVADLEPGGLMACSPEIYAEMQKANEGILSSSLDSDDEENQES